MAIQNIASYMEGHQLENRTYAGEFLIYGHTHEPLVKTEKKIASTGSWVKLSATYLEIDAEGITLKSVV
jgi:predicted phosphodiesterase